MADGHTNPRPYRHAEDRTVAGIVRSFTDAGRDIDPALAEALAARIERDGGMANALANVPYTFSLYTPVDRGLHSLIVAESEADRPENPLASLISALSCGESPIHPGSHERDMERAVRLFVRMRGISPELARAGIERAVADERARIQREAA